MQRFIGDFDLTKKQLQIEDKNIARQLRNVLRAQPGDHIYLCDGKGNESYCKITNITKSVVEVEIIDTTKNKNDPQKHVTLYCSILKRSNFELVVQKATEVGIASIVPIISKRTIKKNIKTERLKKIVTEAAEQSGRGILPVIHKSMKFKDALKHSMENTLNILFHIDEESLPLNSIPNNHDSVGIFIGPEGGWEDDEVSLAVGNNVKIASLGKLTLRAETAAIIASYLIAQI